MTVSDGQIISISGSHGVGKTTLLRAILGLIPIDGGYISIDGELLTPKSAPYFRRQMAYVPQHLSVPEGYDKIDTNYLALLNEAVETGKSMLVVDEPEGEFSHEDKQHMENLLRKALQRGALIVTVNSKIAENEMRL